VITGRAETLPQTNKDKVLHLPLKNPSRPHTTSTIMQRCLGRCMWHTTSTGMSRSLPTSATSGGDSNRRPTSSCRFGCQIKRWAAIPSSRMEWMRSSCHTSSSRPRLRSGRSRMFICSLPPLRSARFCAILRVFLWILFALSLSMYACPSAPRRMFNRVSLPPLGSPLVNLPSFKVSVSPQPLHLHMHLFSIPFCYTQVAYARGVVNQVATFFSSVVVSCSLLWFVVCKALLP
jgi:hypothetical protein